MNLTATLTAPEIDVLSNPHKDLRNTSWTFERTTAKSEYGEESAFERSIRIKNTLDVFEQTARAEPNWRVLAALINCEYQVWRLNADIPLKHNPFLSHWVEALQRLGSPISQVSNMGQTKEVISTEDVTAARVLWIKTLLRKDDIDHSVDATPFEVASKLLKRGISEPFDLQSYIQMLEDEGIFEKTPEPEGAVSSSARPHPDTHNASDYRKAKESKQSYEEEIQQQKQEILRHIQEQPETAIFELTHLPIKITYLDFLTTLLADPTLEKHSIDPAHIITQYIQHALRTVERMDKPPSPLPGAIAGWPEESVAEREQLEYGKEAQSRCILLLLLFIKSLIRKGLVELDILYYEIAEITVRYVWIKEVREFRTWAEEGVEEDGARE